MYKRQVQSLARDGRGVLWVGTDDEGLFRKEGSGFRRVDPSGSGAPLLVRTLCVDRAGVVWAGSTGGGVARPEAEGPRPWRLYTSEPPAARSSGDLRGVRPLQKKKRNR